MYAALDTGRLVDDQRTDAELLRSGDGAAFGLFYDRHARWLLTYFYRRTACPHTAADLAAETMAAAYLSRDRYREERGVPRAWLTGIARHQLARFLRRRRVAEQARRRLGVPPVAIDDGSLERIEALVDLSPLRRRLQEAVAGLSKSVAAAVMLRVGEELPYAEVARRLGCSEGAARVRVTRGLAKLARDLRGGHG